MVLNTQFLKKYLFNRNNNADQQQEKALDQNTIQIEEGVQDERFKNLLGKTQSGIKSLFDKLKKPEEMELEVFPPHRPDTEIEFQREMAIIEGNAPFIYVYDNEGVRHLAVNPRDSYWEQIDE